MIFKIKKMRLKYTKLVFLLILSACANNDNTGSQTKSEQKTEKEIQVFFPVTSYIRGQLIDIKTVGINPKKYTTKENKQDSLWVKSEDFEKEFGEFLQPEIDSINMVPFFSEKSFMDQTLNLVTLTYDPIKELPDSIQWRHWDIYIDPATNAIQRIYLIKQIAPDKKAQLTWQSGKRCKIVVLHEDKSGVSTIERETEIKWNY
jgi:hypothetical protein